MVWTGPGGYGGWESGGWDDGSMMMQQMYEMMMMMKGKGGWGKGSGKGKGKGKDKGSGKGKGGERKKKEGGGNKAPAANLPWKCHLTSAYAKKHKQSPTKDDIVFTTVEEGDGCYVSSITCDKFENTYTGDVVTEGKREAEESVSKAALEAEFPEYFASIPEEGAPSANGGTKRRLAPGEVDAKNRLQNGIQVLLGRNVVKGDIVYSTSTEGSSRVGTVTISCLDGGAQEFKGEPVQAGNDKEAEFAAAEVALASFQDAIDAKMPEHEINKASKRAAFEAKVAEMKAAKEAGEEPPAKKTKTK